MDNESKTTGVVSRETPAKPKDSLSIPLAIVFSGILIAGAILFTETNNIAASNGDTIPARGEQGADSEIAPEAILAIKSDDHVLGNPDAEVLIIEYSDTQCPFCQKFHETMVQVMDNYGKTGTVAWVYRHFPLDQIHPYARKGGEALECAAELGGNTAFWKYEDELFAPATGGLTLEILPIVAGKVGLDVAKFNACLSSGKYAERVDRDFQDGAAVGVRGTPYSVVWNKKTGKQVPVNGALPYENVKTVLGMVTAS